MPRKHIVLCNCLQTQQIDGDALEHALDIGCSRIHNELCMGEIDSAAKAIEAGDAIIACQQERHRFEELASELDREAPEFLDLRDRAGWSDDPGPNTPKMAALIADAQLSVPMARSIDVESAGTCLIVGAPDNAIPAAEQLCEILSVTVLLDPGSELPPADDRRFDIVRGSLKSAAGSLGNFAVEIDAFEQRIPGGRGDPAMTPPQKGAKSDCDIILDLSGKPPLFSAYEEREGYLRADPGNSQDRTSAILGASQLVGTFEQPLYVRLEPQICAHSRARKSGCSRCLDNCPTGAIVPDGDHVSVDARICAGCGACSAVCPSGAISYDAPTVDFVFRRLETLAGTWRTLSSDMPVLLVHDGRHGAELIRLSARHGRGLPANVIPMEVAAVAAFGHAEALAALGCGFGTVFLLVGPKMHADNLPAEVELANAISGGHTVHLMETADPDILEENLYSAIPGSRDHDPVLPLGTRRQVTRLAARTLRGTGEIIELPPESPYGSLELDKDACTLCLSCVSLCPSGALGENPDLPQLRFQEDACLQCGLCANICPETAITLVPRLNLDDSALSQIVLNEEEPFACIECGALFGVRSTVERLTEQLAGKHSMFSDDSAIRIIQMCENCRVQASFHSSDNPFAQGEIPRPRTSDDYKGNGHDH